MKKNILIILIAAISLTSCGTYTGAGAYAGASFGGLLGSAIGGLSGGWRGSDLGRIVGMAGGAAVGAAMGAAADRAHQENREAAAYEQGRRDERRSTNRRSSNREYIQRNSTYIRSNQYGNGTGNTQNRSNTSRSVNADNDGGFDSSNSGDDRIEMK